VIETLIMWQLKVIERREVGVFVALTSRVSSRHGGV
jgi:hypothetical protein